MNASNPTYSDYLLTVSSDLSHWDGFTADQATAAANAVAAAAQTRFPGLVTRVERMGGSPTPTRGPSQDVIDEIDAYAAQVSSQQ